ncbi:MAG: sensor histidine kinase, partial [Acidimicrobiales bacterium]
HELRTPLTLVQGFSELLLTRSNLEEVQSRAALMQIHASSQRLGRLIDDLLSVSRIESGRLSIDVAPLDLSETVSEVVSTFAVDDTHRFVTDIPADLAPVMADRDKTVQVLTNLLSNSIKYSPPGAEVRVSARSVGNHAEIQVIDQGIGMTPEETAGVFEKFSRSGRPEVRKVGGTGLGLYITKNLVELQGGQVWIQSERGCGSTFTFTLPFERVLVARVADEETPCEHC